MYLSYLEEARPHLAYTPKLPPTYTHICILYYQDFLCKKPAFFPLPFSYLRALPADRRVMSIPPGSPFQKCPVLQGRCRCVCVQVFRDQVTKLTVYSIMEGVSLGGQESTSTGKGFSPWKNILKSLFCLSFNPFAAHCQNLSWANIERSCACHNCNRSGFMLQ